MASGLAIRKRLGVAVSLGLLLAVIATFATGFIAAALDLNRFAYHKYAAYVAIGLAAAHVVLHWRVLLAQLRRWVFGQAPVSPSPDAPLVSRRTLLSPGITLLAGATVGSFWSRASGPPLLQEGEDLGQVYHEWSKPSYSGTLLKLLRVRPQPPLYKEYHGAQVVPLPPLPEPGGMPLEVAIARRRSIREYADRPVTLEELSRLLHSSTGITDRRDPTYAFRAVPSSGALFPLEVYPVVFQVEGLQPGVYHYGVEHHRLELLQPGDFRQDVFRAAVSQEMLLRASLALVLTGIHARVQFKYADRSYRYLLLEAGHLGQNVYLAATSLGLAPCGIGAFFDDDLNRLVRVDGQDEATVYLLAVGAAPA